MKFSESVRAKVQRHVRPALGSRLFALVQVATASNEYQAPFDCGQGEQDSNQVEERVCVVLACVSSIFHTSVTTLRIMSFNNKLYMHRTRRASYTATSGRKHYSQQVQQFEFFPLLWCWYFNGYIPYRKRPFFVVVLHTS